MSSISTFFTHESVCVHILEYQNYFFCGEVVCLLDEYTYNLKYTRCTILLQIDRLFFFSF